jgi:hypothetical protein
VDRHERLANGDERASVGASSSRQVFRHHRYDADDADDDDSSFGHTAAHVAQRDAVVLPLDDRVRRPTAVPMSPMTRTISKNAPINT